MNESVIRDAIYAGRFAWVDLKRLVGVPLSSDKSHLCERIVRAAHRGLLHPLTAFTSGVRPDGLGAMILQRLSIQAAARYFGFDYYHTPFGFVGHPEAEPEEWSRMCEVEFDLGVGFPRVSDCELPYIEFTDYALDTKAWAKPYLVGFREMFQLCNSMPQLYSELGWPAYFRDKVRCPDRPVKRIAVHVRRGDVNPGFTARRYMANEVIINSIKNLTSIFDFHRLNYSIEIYSNGKSEELFDFKKQGFLVFDDLGAIDTFRSLVSADCLFMAKSSFSYVAGICSGGLVVYREQDYSRLADWVPMIGIDEICGASLEKRLSKIGWVRS